MATTSDTKQLLVRLDPDLFRDLSTAAAEAGMPKVEIVSRALKGYLPFLRDQIRQSHRSG